MLGLPALFGPPAFLESGQDSSTFLSSLLVSFSLFSSGGWKEKKKRRLAETQKYLGRISAIKVAPLRYLSIVSPAAFSTGRQVTELVPETAHRHELREQATPLARHANS